LSDAAAEGPPDPSANPTLLGQARAEGVLLRAWQGGRLPHAWLLRGPQGVGKATLAFRFARRLLAGDEHEAAASDPKHPVFRMVANGAHPDLRVLRRTPNPRTGKLYKEILVDQVRSADAALHATSARGGFRVLVVDPADELSDSGANALLKLIEEPPPGVVILLVCQRRGLLRPTIVSRCAQLTLSPLGPADVAAGLAVLAPEIPAERLRALVDLARGSIGRAVELERSGWIESYAEVLQRLRAARGSEAARLTLATQLTPWIDRLGVEGLTDLLGFVLRRLAQQEAGRPPGAELVEGEALLLADLAAGHGLDRWVGLWEKLATSARRVESLNLDPLIALLQLVQGVCGVDPEVELRLT